MPSTLATRPITSGHAELDLLALIPPNRRRVYGINERSALSVLMRAYALHGEEFSWDIIQDHTLDGMHCVAGIAKKHMLPLVSGLRGVAALAPPRKPAAGPGGGDIDNDNMRAKAARLATRNGVRARANDDVARWVATAVAIERADGRFSRLRGPKGFKRGNLAPFRHASKWKSHTYQMYWETGQMAWHWSFLGLPPAKYDAAVKLSRAAGLVSRRSLTPADRAALVGEVSRLVQEGVRELPRTERTVLFHRLVEAALDVTVWGPAWARAMYQIESFLGYLGRLVSNRAAPEASMMQLHQILQFAQATEPESDRLQAELDDDLDEAILDRDCLTFSRFQRSRADAANRVVVTAGVGVEVHWVPYRFAARIASLIGREGPASRQAGLQGVELPSAQVGGLARTTRQSPGARSSPYTTRYFTADASALGEGEQILLGVGNGTAVYGELVRFFIPHRPPPGRRQQWEGCGRTADLLAEVIVFELDRDPVFDLPIVYPDPQAGDNVVNLHTFIRASEIGDPIGLGPGCGGLHRDDRAWTVICCRAGRH
jgi:hypothetical protein